VVIKRPIDLKKMRNGRGFCSRSCAVSFNNKLKRKSRRSKVEVKFFQLLCARFPDLTMLPNDKTLIPGLETDIAIPSLKIAVEWNGIVHFEPIYGHEKLSAIQRKDAEKKLKATELGIHLIIISDFASDSKTVSEAFEQVSEFIEQMRT
jgi:hypothetical protein